MLTLARALGFGLSAGLAFGHAVIAPAGVVLVVAGRFRSAHVALKSMCLSAARFAGKGCCMRFHRI